MNIFQRIFKPIKKVNSIEELNKVPIGKVVKFQGVKLEVRRSYGMHNNCYFRDKNCAGIICNSASRYDKTDVIFKQV